MAELAPPSKLNKQRILIVNDDGIEGPGIKLLEQLVREMQLDLTSNRFRHYLDRTLKQG
jgi:hypothetical protein